MRGLASLLVRAEALQRLTVAPLTIDIGVLLPDVKPAPPVDVVVKPVVRPTPLAETPKIVITTSAESAAATTS
jgi:hypothetical protein